MSQLISYLKTDLLTKMLGDISIVTELKGGMSSNKCFYVKSNSLQFTCIVFKDSKKSDKEILDWHNVTLSLKNFRPRVRIPVNTNITHFIFDNIKYKACLYNYIDGKTIMWSGYNSSQIHELGLVMNRLHTSLSNFSLPLPSWREIMIDDLEKFISYINFVNPYIEQKIHIKINQTKLSKNIKIIINYLNTNYEQTVLHYDLQRANLIFKNNELNGIIDFEKACRGPRIADIAKSCAYLMHDKKWHSTKYIKYHFFLGYGKTPDIQMLNPLIIHHFLMEMKNWMFNTPFESLNENKVFSKIIKYLIKQNYVTQL